MNARNLSIGLGILLGLVCLLGIPIVAAVTGFATYQLVPPQVEIQEVEKVVEKTVIVYLTTTPQPIETQDPEPTATPQPTPTTAIGSIISGSLNYDETNGDPLTPGQTQLIAPYLRIAAPITQADLEAAIVKIQQEAISAKAEINEGSTLTLDQRKAWLVWCSNAQSVDIPADVSLIHEVSLLDPATLGRVWIQVPFAEGVPLRSDDTWTGCGDFFWSVAVH